MLRLFLKHEISFLHYNNLKTEHRNLFCVSVVRIQFWFILMCMCFLASKKMTEKLKTSSVADDLSSVPLTEGLGQPLQGQPLNEEMIVMEGNSNIPPDSAADDANTQPADTDGTDGSKSERDDL